MLESEKPDRSSVEDFLNSWTKDQEKERKKRKRKKIIFFSFFFLLLSWIIYAVFDYLACRGALFGSYECLDSYKFIGLILISLVLIGFSLAIFKLREGKFGATIGTIFLIIGIIFLVLSVKNYFWELNFEKNYKFKSIDQLIEKMKSERYNEVNKNGE